MRFDIQRLRRYGKPLGRSSIGKDLALRGDVHIRIAAPTPFKRPSLIAEILNPGPNGPVLPILHDVQIHGMASNSLVITGIEFIDGVAYSQSWHCRVT